MSDEAVRKIYEVMKAIESASHITALDRPIIIHHGENDELWNVSEHELFEILHKLETDNNVIRIMYTPSAMDMIDEFGIAKTPLFDAYLKEIEKKVRNAEQENAEKFPQALNKESTAQNRGAAVYWIVFNQNREILLNGVFLLSRPQVDSVNFNVFGFVFNNPNREIGIDEIQTAIRQELKKPLHDIFKELGFKKDILKAFLVITKKRVLFRNPVSRDQLDALGMSNIKISAPSSSRNTHSETQ